MRISRRFHILKQRITQLENTILPPERIDGNYTDREIDLVKSYLLLVHAEIEAYFEDIARDKITAALKSWVANRRLSSCLKAVLAYPGNELDYSTARQEDSYNIEFRLNRAVNHFQSLLRKNNGIKRIDLLKILIPIGVELVDIDDLWLNTMESFGSLRGRLAHNSHQTITIQFDRNTEKDRVNRLIMPEIERLDVFIKRLS